MILKSKLEGFIKDPYNLQVNLDLGYLYEQENQLASAISHYLRGAEYGLDNTDKDKRVLIAECLLRAASCMDKLGGRNHSTKSLILHAISYLPSLPQAHLQMSKIYEVTGEWGECNTYCSLGIDNIDLFQHLRYDNRSKNEILNELLYQKAISNYYIGKTQKARLDLVKLRRKPDLQNWIISAIDKSLITIGYPHFFNQIGYDFQNNTSNKEVFKDRNFVSYSQCMQDIFVSTIVNKKFGSYVEIGSHDPIENNNTNLLEKEYSWRGISIDIDKGMVEKFNSTRINKAIAEDATKIDYKSLFAYNNMPKDIGYLQLDCDPALTTYEILTKIPFDEYRFATITFEHDYYNHDGGFNVRDESRKFLQEKGYELLIADITKNCIQSFEDWWIHPELAEKYISREKLNSIKDITSNPKCLIDIFF